MTFNIFDAFQSGFRELHSTKSASLKVTKDILLSLDSGPCCILILRAAFDSANHDLFLNYIIMLIGSRESC